MITHYDLFSGIGGFSLALEEVFKDEPIKHIFCEWEQFPTAVLRQHWPDGEFWGDIAELVAHTKRAGLEGPAWQGLGTPRSAGHFSIVTGGFPCQPFSHAGRRKGTADDRYQWPNMFAVIRNVRPEWVIAENVRGLVTWNEGLVLETVCADLESEGYEVQPLIIPAVAVNAPHRRDRVWIIAHGGYAGLQRWNSTQEGQQSSARRQSRSESAPQDHPYPDWSRNWKEVALATCNDPVDDGIPRLVDGVPQSFARWRKESLKAYGNGIVPQVAIEIFKAIHLIKEGLIDVGEK